MSDPHEDEKTAPVTRSRPAERAAEATPTRVDQATSRRLRLGSRPMRIGLLVLAAALLLATAFAVWWNVLRTPPLVGFAAGNGRIESTQIDIATRIAGRVDAVLAEEGDLVEAGQVLARIDAASLEAQLDEAQAALEESVEIHRAAGATFNQKESLARLARRELERTRELFAAHVSSQDVLDRRRTDVETSNATVEEALRQVKRAERGIEVAAARLQRLHVDLGEATLVAPRAGRVLYRLAEPGEVLPVGGKVLSLVEEGDAYMTIFLSEHEAAQARLGAEARLRLDGIDDRLWPAAVSFVAPVAQFTPNQVETATEREKLVFKVKVALPDPVDPVIKPGMRGVAFVRLDPQATWPDRLP